MIQYLFAQARRAGALRALGLLGKDPATKLDEFLEKFQTALNPRPPFWKIILQIFYNEYGRIYARRHRPDSIS